MRTVLLTIDDGPTTATNKILDLAAENGCGIVFFAIGKKIVEHEEVCKRIIQDGHILANHTWNHPISRHTRTRSKDYYQREIARTQREIKRLYREYGNGRFERMWFRFPGLVDAPNWLNQVLQRNGYVHPFGNGFYWDRIDINLRDGTPKTEEDSCLTKEQIRVTVEKNITERKQEPDKRPLIILSHDVAEQVKIGFYEILFGKIAQRMDLQLFSVKELQKLKQGSRR